MLVELPNPATGQPIELDVTYSLAQPQVTSPIDLEIHEVYAVQFDAYIAELEWFTLAQLTKAILRKLN